MELEQLDYDHTLHENRNKADTKLYVRFFMDIIPDDEATKASGMKKFRDVEMVQIMAPGDKRNIVIRVARDDDKARFASLYEKFKQNTSEEALNGYPLSQWPGVTRAQVEELKYLGFRTVEHVAGASDAVAGRYPGLRELQRRAQSFLEVQKNNAPVEQLNAALKSRDEVIAAMQAQLDALIESNKAAAQAKKAA